MVKPYCEDCGKHRGSNPYCCESETRRIDNARPLIVTALALIALGIAALWLSK